MRGVNEGPSARFSAAGDCVDARNGVLVWIGGCNGSLDALDDMYYLYTSMSYLIPLLFLTMMIYFVFIAVDMHGGGGNILDGRPEKLSFRKELKRKCLDVDLNKNGSTLVAHQAGIHSRMISQERL